MKTVSAPVRPKIMVARTLAGRILQGEYPPGSPLPPESTLLAEFGVSRTCLREALQVLGAKGLVVSRPRIGTLVAERIHWNFLDADMLRWRQTAVDRAVVVRELFAVRRMVEPETAALAAANIDAATLDALQAAIIEMARGNGERTPETIEADVDFHRLLLAASGNALLSGLGAVIEEALRASIWITSDPVHGARFALDMHIAVFEAVRDGKPDAARKATVALLDMTGGVLARAGFEDAGHRDTERGAATAA